MHRLAIVMLMSHRLKKKSNFGMPSMPALLCFSTGKIVDGAQPTAKDTMSGNADTFGQMKLLTVKHAIAA